MSGRYYDDFNIRHACPGKVFYIDENGELKLRPTFRNKVNMDTKPNHMNIKRLEEILKKHIKQQGTSIVFNITKAADEINAFVETTKKAEIEEKLSNYKFKLSYIKNVLSDIDEVPISIKDIRKLAKKRNKKKSTPTKKTAKIKS